MELDLFYRRLDELLAVASGFPEAMTQVSPEELHAHLLTEGSEPAALAHLASQPITLSIRVTSPAEHGASDPAPTEPAATLHATLPPGYPLQPCTCSVWSSALPKPWQALATTQLQSLADAAAAEGRECLWDLLHALENLACEALAPGGAAEKSGAGRLAARGAAPAPGGSSTGCPGAEGPRSRSGGWGGGGGGISGEPGAEGDAARAGPLDGAPGTSCGGGSSGVGAGVGGVAGPIQLVLLKLDHMRDRGGYCRTVRRWCGELELTGRLLFAGPLILALLEGAPADVRECLARWRTRNVDVDSKGRACKERMMDVVGEAERPCRSFQTFEVLGALPSLDQLRLELEQAGASAWLPAAAGLAPATGAGGQAADAARQQQQQQHQRRRQPG